MNGLCLVRVRALLLLMVAVWSWVVVTDRVCAEVVVHISDGRTLRGDVDARTDDHQLWIRYEEDRIVLTTAVAWSSIAEVAVDGEFTTPDALRERVAELASAGPVAFLAWQDEGEAVGALPRFTSALLPRPRVVSVEIDAVLVNRDRDIEPDGLEVWVAVLDCDGLAVPVRGSFAARLWGERLDRNDRRRRFVDHARWSQTVCEADFSNGVACYYLPFRTIRPEFDDRLATDAHLNVRLSVHGEGNFEASVPVHLRRFDPLRDRLELFEGSRFFRDELTDEVRR